MEWVESHRFETHDGYAGGFCKLDGVHIDGYLTEVRAPKWTYTARCSTEGRARSWCRHIVMRDRKQPMRRGKMPSLYTGD
jgi:hypothetical protein